MSIGALHQLQTSDRNDSDSQARPHFVDFVVEHGRRLLALEVKRTTEPGYGDTTGLRAFLAEHPKASGRLLLHSEREIRRLDKNIVAVPSASNALIR